MKSRSQLSQTRLGRYRRLLQKKYREKDHCFLIEGVRLLREALSSPWQTECVLVTERTLGKSETGKLIAEADAKGVDVLLIGEKDLETLADTETSQGVLGVVRIKPEDPSMVWERTGRNAVIVALDGVSDPGNVGTIIRTAEWFHAAGVLLGRDTVELFNPKVIRSTMGALFHMPVVPHADLNSAVAQARKNHFTVFASLPSGGKQLHDTVFPACVLLLLGSEAHGLSRSLASIGDAAVTIPRYGLSESLNVSTACGIILSAFRSQYPE